MIQVIAPTAITRSILTIFCILLFTAASPQDYCSKILQLKAVDYKLDLRPDFAQEKLYATCEITVLNTGSETTSIPLLLYRLLKIREIKDENGKMLPFTQKVLSFDDFEAYQANYAEVQLNEPLKQQKNIRLTIEYEGYLLGYAETGMRYIQDRIDPDFTILRNDCLAFPEPGYPCEKVNRAAGFDPHFNYLVTVKVPDSLVVVNGGSLVSKVSGNGTSTYTYKNKKPAWRIDVAIGNYQMLEMPLLRLYYLKEDSAGAKMVFEAAKKAIDQYSQWWGNLDNAHQFSLIELKNGYGSQADVTSVLQSAGAFKDRTELRQVYHELSHLWNVHLKDRFSPRWDEGLATFIEYLSMDEFDEKDDLDYVTRWFLGSIKKDLDRNENLGRIPLIDFGKAGMTDYAYSVGMIMFQVLYFLVGPGEFHQIIKENYQRNKINGGSTSDFVALAKNISTKDLNRFFQDFLYTSKYTDHIKAGRSIQEMVRFYDNQSKSRDSKQ